jgi:hypothetical protein
VESFVIFASLLFLMTGIINFGLVFTHQVPDKESCRPLPIWYYYAISALFIGLAFWGVIVL